MMTGMSVYSVAWGKWGGVIRHVVAWAALASFFGSSAADETSTLAEAFDFTHYNLYSTTSLQHPSYDNQGRDEQSRRMMRIFIFKSLE